MVNGGEADRVRMGVANRNAGRIKRREEATNMMLGTMVKSALELWPSTYRYQYEVIVYLVKSSKCDPLYQHAFQVGIAGQARKSDSSFGPCLHMNVHGCKMSSPHGPVVV